MALKYLIDAALIGTYGSRFWSPLDYLNPLITLRQEVLRGAPDWVAPAMILIALPFLWIGVSMTARRAVATGGSPWLALLFFVPVVNYALMLLLAVIPSASKITWPVEAPPPAVDERFKSALLGVAVAIGITVVSLVVGVYLRRLYSAGLFLGVPFTIGYVSANIYTRRVGAAEGGAVRVAMAGVLVAGLAVVLFAVEGVLCTAMALPVAALVALPGALLGQAFAASPRPRPGSTALGLLCGPLLVALEPRPAATTREVVTVVEVDAPPEVVWRHVVTFPALAPAREWLFRAGVAAPVAARIEGTGVGATRYCDFTTGSFVEPITAWEEGRLLAFDITGQAPPMRELSPYGRIDAPHLDGYFRATYGEFRMEGLAGGRTRIVGRTRYVVDMFPQAYWTLVAGAIVEAIHRRVLRHIEALAKAD